MKRIPLDTQAMILTYARRRWPVARIARALHVHWTTVRRCVDAWGLARRRLDA